MVAEDGQGIVGVCLGSFRRSRRSISHVSRQHTTKCSVYEIRLIQTLLRFSARWPGGVAIDKMGVVQVAVWS